MTVAGFYYILIANTIGYILLIVLGWRMYCFVQHKLELAQNSEKKSAKLNSQFMRTLLIQVSIIIEKHVFDTYFYSPSTTSCWWKTSFIFNFGHSPASLELNSWCHGWYQLILYGGRKKFNLMKFRGNYAAKIRRSLDIIAKKLIPKPSLKMHEKILYKWLLELYATNFLRTA